MTILCVLWLFAFLRDFSKQTQVLILGLVGSAAVELAKGCMIHFSEKQTWGFRTQ